MDNYNVFTWTVTYVMLEDPTHVLFERTVTIEGERHTDTVPAGYVTVYRISRLRGGPEEGGWWYDHYDPVCSVPTDGTRADVETCTSFLSPRYKGFAHFIFPEVERGQHETRERPRYC